jgi:hypothetical protein
VAFRPPHDREKAPKCMICRGTTPHAVTGFGGTIQWICAACEYRTAYPDAPLIPTVPNLRKPLPLQTEVLFTD